MEAKFLSLLSLFFLRCIYLFILMYAYTYTYIYIFIYIYILVGFCSRSTRISACVILLLQHLFLLLPPKGKKNSAQVRYPKYVFFFIV